MVRTITAGAPNNNVAHHPNVIQVNNVNVPNLRRFRIYKSMWATRKGPEREETGLPFSRKCESSGLW